MPAVLWFRRDLRLTDHPALLAARSGGEVLPLFVLDPALLGPAGAPRTAFLLGCLAELDAATGGALRVVTGRPEDVVPAVAAAADADSVHVSSDHAPYGRARDERVAAALGAAGAALVRTGSPYAVTPGRLLTGAGAPYRVYTPYARAWSAHGVRLPAAGPAPRWTDGGLPTETLPPAPATGGTRLPPAGERAARARWEDFRSGPLDGYAQGRDRAADAATSGLSPYLRFGCLHPRTVLADLAAEQGDGAATLRGELAWRDFYADVLWHRPASARTVLQESMAALSYDEGPEADACFEAWTAGRTGYPFVDAGMRQLAGTAWMHNRLRMVVASFLCKDLHVDWRRGARHFMTALVDGDLASNQHGWQWVAGTGTDPSPYFRVFNPVRQGLAHDPDGDYVRRWVPELRGVAGPRAHEPWLLPGGLPAGYPERVVDHTEERADALRRYAATRQG